jgi:uncharacterized protein
LTGEGNLRAIDRGFHSIVSNAIIFVAMVLSFGYCLDVPALNGRINDHAGLLSEKNESELTAYLAEYEHESGNQIAVLTIQSLHGENLEEYSIRVADSWKLGKATVDNGVLILVVKKERGIRIEVGYGLESSITDLEADRIIRESIMPAFAKSDFDKGIADAIREVRAAIEADSSTLQPSATQAAPSMVSTLMNVAFVGLLALFGVWFFVFGSAGNNLGFAIFVDIFMALPYMVVSYVVASMVGEIGMLCFPLLVVGYPFLCIWVYKYFAKTKLGRMLALDFLFSSSSSESSSGSGGSSSGSSRSFSGGGGGFGGGGSSGKW